MELFVWGLLASCCVIGILGSLLPVLPGLPLIALGVLVHKVLLPHVLSWWVVGLTMIASIVSFILDWSLTALSVKWSGATRYGFFGAFIGAILGVLSGGWGILIGPVIGAALAEIFFAQRGVKPALKSGMGAGIGAVLAAVARVFLTLAVVVMVSIHSCSALTKGFVPPHPEQQDEEEETMVKTPNGIDGIAQR